MARLWWESFEGQHDQKWSLAEGTIVPTNLALEIGDGTRVLELPQNSQRTITFDANFTETYMAFWYRPGFLQGNTLQNANYRDGQPEFLCAWYKNITRLVSFAISNVTRKMTLYYLNDYNTKIAQGTHIYSDHTQAHLEIRYKMAPSGGSVQVWQDGALDLDFDNADTAPGSDTTYNMWQIYSPNSGGFPAYFDSFMLNDLTDPGGPSAGKDIGRMGVKHLWGQLPDADSAVNNAWQRSTGSNGWALVDERPPNTTDYVFATTNALKQGFLFEPHGLPVNATVDAVIHEHSMIKITDGAVKIGMRSNGVEHLNPTEAVATSYQVNEIRLTEDPDGDVNWTLLRADQIESLAESVF